MQYFIVLTEKLSGQVELLNLAACMVLWVKMIAEFDSIAVTQLTQ